MNRPILVGFGDSWAYGTGLARDESCYINLLGNKLGIPNYNYAVAGSSVPHLILQLKNFIQQQYSTDNITYAIFFITAMERDLIFTDQGQPNDLSGPHPHQPAEYINYYAEIYTDHLASFRLNTSLLTLTALCKHYNINAHYIFGWQTPKLWPEINLDQFYQYGQKSIMDVFLGNDIEPTHRNIIFLKNSNNPYMLPSIANVGSAGHPNQLGHKKIAEVLNEWIKI
jgi:lysophospholipase L1-like esterase